MEGVAVSTPSHPPLEFSHAEEARAATMGPFFQRQYGLGVTGTATVARDTRECIECHEVKEWAGNHRRCPSCRAARQRDRADKTVPITAAEIDAMLAGRMRTLTSLAMGYSRSYLSSAANRGRIGVEELALLKMICGVGE
jgi:hypothetical protein